MVQPDKTTDDCKIWHMRFLYCVTEAKETHSVYVIFIVFP
jgi:hypothetical protein